MEWDDYLKDVCNDARYDLEARKLAAKLLKDSAAGLVPSMRLMAELRRLAEADMPCGQLQPDGSCPWLRRNARNEGLRAPGPGERVQCNRRAIGPLAATFKECSGYRMSGE
jgi:hypothetical protein